MPLSWNDADAIAERLHSRFPDIDPLTIRFPDLQRWIGEIDDFVDDPKPTSPYLLEHVQRSWYEAYRR